MTLEDYRRACKIAATIVAIFGDRYLPIFERAHQELKKAEAQIDLRIIALQIAKENG